MSSKTMPVALMSKMGGPERSGPPWSDGAKIRRRGLSGLAILGLLIFDLLTFVQAAHSGSFDRTDVDEYVLAALIRLNEAVTLLAIKPLYCSGRHRTFSD